jgi:hypothetical protein
MNSVKLEEAQLVTLVETYFAAVDRKDVDGTLACFSPTARLPLPIMVFFMRAVSFKFAACTSG